MKRFTLLMLLAIGAIEADACTSMIVTADASATGRPLMWKHRDTGADNNFMQRVEATDSTIGYVGLFNGGDSLLAEAWMGMNDAGFAVMNTASYNLAPDTAKFQDQEGRVMTLALRRCRTVDDFEALLATLPKPMGVQANFGVIDASGGAAYFETDDHQWTRRDIAAGEVAWVTNFSYTGTPGGGYGYTRMRNVAEYFTDPETGDIKKATPRDFTESLSRNLVNVDTDTYIYLDSDNDDVHLVASTGFIPRRISTSSIVIEGVNTPEEASEICAWAVPGFPPVSFVSHVTLTDIPDRWLPDASWRSQGCDESRSRIDEIFVCDGATRDAYIDVDALREIIDANDCIAKSAAEYEKYSR